MPVKKDSLLSLQRLNLKNYLHFAKTKKFAELSESQNLSNTNDLKQSSDFLQIDSTKNNETRHFFIDKHEDKIIEESNPPSYRSPLKLTNNEKEGDHFEFKDLMIPTIPSHILDFKEEVEDKFLDEKSENKSPTNIEMNVLDELEEINQEKSFRKTDLLLIGKETESLKESQVEGRNSQDSIVLLPPMPNASIFSSFNNSNVEHNIYLRKKFSMEKIKIGFSTITMKRDISLFNKQEKEKEMKSADSLNKMFSSNSENLELERLEKLPTNKKVMNELENIEKHIILKRNLENFLILFNDNPEDGIAYLIDSNMVCLFLFLYLFN